MKDEGVVDIVFSMSGGGSSGGGGGGKPKAPKVKAPKVKVTTSTGHPAVKAKIRADAAKPALSADDLKGLQKVPTPDAEADRLKSAWKQLEATRAELEARERKLADEWPEDLSGPLKIPTVPAIDWDQQPAVPAEKIDWSHQGEPLRVRPTLGVMVTAIALIVSILGGGAYFYWGVKTHVANGQIHVAEDGIPWGVKAAYETRSEANAVRRQLRKDIVSTMQGEHAQLKADIVRAIHSPRPASPRRKR